MPKFIGLINCFPAHNTQFNYDEGLLVGVAVYFSFECCRKLLDLLDSFWHKISRELQFLYSYFRCHSMVCCTYNMLNIFRALLCPSSWARDYMCVIIAYGVQCLVAGCRGQVQGSRLCVQEEGCCTTKSCNILRNISEGVNHRILNF